MKTTITFIALSIVFCVQMQNTVAQEYKSTFTDEFYVDEDLRASLPWQQRHALLLSTVPVLAIDTTIDVLTYDLTMDWVMSLLTPHELRPLRKFDGHVSAEVLLNTESDTIGWNARGLMIDSIKIDHISATFDVDNGRLSIYSDQDLHKNNTVQIDVWYAGLADNRGFNALDATDAAALDMPHAIAFTFSEPEDARRWYPCHDIPTDKAIFTVHVRVPTGFTVVSNGTMQDSVVDSDTTTIQTWHHPDLMPTYLFTVNASIYSRYDQTYTGNRTIPIYNFQWPEDQKGQLYNVERALQNLPRMFEAFEEDLGSYPWPSYGHVTVAPMNYGGMEHQTMTTVNRRWLIGDVEIGYAHELGHQWLGNAVTCATWSDIWLNEGGASFTEALWKEFNEGPIGYINHLNNRRAKYMQKGLDEPAVYGIPLDNLFNEGTTYCKSAWVYHMMRRLVGDSQFFPMLRSWIHDGENTNKQTYQLLEHVKTMLPNTPVPWDVYFDQWLIKRGHPIFVGLVSFKPLPINGQYTTTVQISQSQSGDNIPEVFITPLTIRLYGTQRVYDTTVFIDQRTTNVTIRSPFLPDSGEFNPNSDVLCQQVIQIVTDVSEEEDHHSTLIAPVPVRRGSPLYITNGVGATSIRVNATNGAQIEELQYDGGAKLLNTSQWPIGVVYIVVQTGATTTTHMVPVID